MRPEVKRRMKVAGTIEEIEREIDKMLRTNVGGEKKKRKIEKE